MSQVIVITGRDRRRKWGSEERGRILAAAFAPGAVISSVARQFDVASSMIYKWRHEARAANRALAFAPAVVMEDIPAVPSTSEVPPAAPSATTAVSITVEFSVGVRVTMDAAAPTALVTAVLLALQ
jgi:transposase